MSMKKTAAILAIKSAVHRNAAKIIAHGIVKKAEARMSTARKLASVITRGLA